MSLTVFRAKFGSLAAILLVGLLLASGCSAPEETASRTRPPVTVVVDPVKLSNQALLVEAVGTSRALRSVTLHPVAAGEIVSVNFEPGDFVEAGDVLLQMDQRKEKLAVELAEFRLKEATSLHERYVRSAETGATLPTTLEAARTELEAARIALGQSRIELQDRTIVAPFSGHVGLTDLDAGDRIQPDTAVTTLDNREALLVSFELPEVLLDRVSQGHRLELQTWELNSLNVIGEIVDIGSRVDPELRTFLVRAKVDNLLDNLRPGMSFRVRLSLEGDRHPELPEIAVQWGSDGAFVWTIEDGLANRVPVNIIQRKQGKVLIQGAIDEDSVVIVEGIQRLRPGLAVQPNTAIAQDVDAAGKKPAVNG